MMTNHLLQQIMSHVTISRDIQAAIFLNAELMINAVSVYRSSNLYPFPVNYANLLSDSAEQKNALTYGCYYPDTTSNFNTGNAGYMKRMALTDLSRSFDFMRKPYIPIIDSNRPLPPNLDWSFTYYRAPDTFLLCGGEPTPPTGYSAAAKPENNCA